MLVLIFWSTSPGGGEGDGSKLVGIAADYWEALLLLRSMTGACCVVFSMPVPVRACFDLGVKGGALAGPLV